MQYTHGLVACYVSKLDGGGHLASTLCNMCLAAISFELHASQLITVFIISPLGSVALTLAWQMVLSALLDSSEWKV